MSRIDGVDTFEQRSSIAQPANVLDALHVPLGFPTKGYECFNLRSDLSHRISTSFRAYSMTKHSPADCLDARYSTMA